RRALAEMRRHAAERPLIDSAILGARERHAVVLELDHRGGRLAAHVLDRVLVAEPVRPLDGVVHVPAPVVLAHVAERGADPALGRDRVAACRKHLADRGGLETQLGEPEGRTQPRPARADHDDVVRVVDELVFAAHGAGESAIFRIANSAAIAIAAWTNVDRASRITFAPPLWT